MFELSEELLSKIYSRIDDSVLSQQSDTEMYEMCSGCSGTCWSSCSGEDCANDCFGNCDDEAADSGGGW